MCSCIVEFTTLAIFPIILNVIHDIRNSVVDFKKNPCTVCLIFQTSIDFILNVLLLQLGLNLKLIIREKNEWKLILSQFPTAVGESGSASPAISCLRRPTVQNAPNRNVRLRGRLFLYGTIKLDSPVP